MKIIKLILINTIVFLGLFASLTCGLEIYSYIKISLKKKEELKSYSTVRVWETDIKKKVKYVRGDSNVTGYMLHPNLQMTARGLFREHSGDPPRIINEEVYCNSVSNTDNFRRRVVPEPSYVVPNKHLIFFGGSFTYGLCVNDNETLPSQLSSRLKIKTYNYADQGWGPHQFLSIMNSRDLNREMDSSTGLMALYVYIPGHITRAIGGYPVYSKTKHPHFALNTNKEIIRAGFHRDHKTPISDFLLENSYFFKYFFPYQPLTYMDYDFFGILLTKIKNDLIKKNVAQDLGVILYPTISENDRKSIINQLKKRGITYFDLPDLIFSRPEHTLHQEDHHPNKKAYKLLSKELVEPIGDKIGNINKLYKTKEKIFVEDLGQKKDSFSDGLNTKSCKNNHGICDKNYNNDDESIIIGDRTVSMQFKHLLSLYFQKHKQNIWKQVTFPDCMPLIKNLDSCSKHMSKEIKYLVNTNYKSVVLAGNWITSLRRDSWIKNKKQGVVNYNLWRLNETLSNISILKKKVIVTGLIPYLKEYKPSLDWNINKELTKQYHEVENFGVQKWLNSRIKEIVHSYPNAEYINIFDFLCNDHKKCWIGERPFFFFKNKNTLDSKIFGTFSFFALPWSKIEVKV